MKKILIAAAVFLLLTGCALHGQGSVPPEEPSADTSSAYTAPEETQSSAPTETGNADPLEPPTTETAPRDPQKVAKENPETGDFKAIWLSQYDLWDIYLSDGVQRVREDFTDRMSRVLDNIRAQGFNTVLLQVRPNGDSMYPSVYYPMSKYVVGQYGREADYDPVEIIVSLAKARNLSIHAWINPMRCMTTAELEQVDDAFLIRRWYDDPERNGSYIVQHGSYWYLNPAYEEVRQLILIGAAELLDNYDFDGIHMDDYFYPTTDAAFDAGAYAACGEGMALDAFRRENLNILVSGLYEVTKACGKEKLYGISPAGNIRTVYDSHYADVYTWCSREGYIDYICPQVYFGLEHQSFDFVSVCNTWQDIIQSDSVDLIIGMTMEKALSREDKYAGSGKNEWQEHQDILKRCLEYTAKLSKCRGISVFSYQHFFSPVTGEEVAGTAAERENFVPLLQEITWQN